MCGVGYSTVNGQTVRDALWIPIQTCRLQTTEPLVHYVQDVDKKWVEMILDLGLGCKEVNESVL